MQHVAELRRSMEEVFELNSILPQVPVAGAGRLNYHESYRDLTREAYIPFSVLEALLTCAIPIGS